VRELEPLQLELADVRATCQAMREANTQLQQEVDRCRRELRETRRHLTAAEDKIREKDDIISETRQRLFDAKERGAKFEDVVKEQSEVQNALQGRLQSTRELSVVSETQLRNLRTSLGASMESLRFSGSVGGNVGYSRSAASLLGDLSAAAGGPIGGGTGPASAASLGASWGGGVGHVDASDELAVARRPDSPRQDGSAASDLPFRQLARQSRGSAPGVPGSFSNGFGSGACGGSGLLGSEGNIQDSHRSGPSLPTIPRSSAEEWSRAAKISQMPGVLLSQPAPSNEVLARTRSNFRALLLAPQGPLYEDSRIRLDLTGVTPASRGSSARPGLLFELVVVNVGSNAIQEVQLAPLEPSRTHACELILEPQPLDPSMHRQGGSLWRGQSVRFAGRLDVFGPFEATPPVELSFLLPDGMASRIRLRLPLPLTRLMAAAGVPPEPRIITDLWSSPDFAHTEVAFSCAVSTDLLGPGAPFTVWRCLELSGVFRVLPGLDDNPRGALLASVYPQRQGTPQEVLLRVELGGSSGPGGTPYGVNGTSLPYAETSICRVAVRSASHLVNRAVAQVALEVLCDPAAAAAAANGGGGHGGGGSSLIPGTASSIGRAGR